MLLNRLEYFLMNNPARATIQRHVEARRLLTLGGRMKRGRALEIGCGQGVGAELILDLFGARSVDAFDLDSSMVRKARQRLRHRASLVRLWTGDVTAIAAADCTYDAVFDFGILHHVPDWRRALSEVHRVLRPGGRFYAEEALRRLIANPFAQWAFRHPEADRFSQADFGRGLQLAGFKRVADTGIADCFAWFVADRPASHDASGNPPLPQPARESLDFAAGRPDEQQLHR